MTVPVAVAVMLALGFGFACATISGFIAYGLGRQAGGADEVVAQQALTEISFEWQQLVTTGAAPVQHWRHRRVETTRERVGEALANFRAVVVPRDPDLAFAEYWEVAT